MPLSAAVAGAAGVDLMEGLPRPLILGSGSSTRQSILNEMGIDFCVVVRPIDERSLGDRGANPAPEELVRTLAHAKMDHLLNEIESGRCGDDLPDRPQPLEQQDDGDSDNDDSNRRSRRPQEEWVVLTADQVVWCDGKILEKPDDVAQAKEFVALYGNHPCTTVGCVVVTHLPSRITAWRLHTATLHFHPGGLAVPGAAARLVDALVRAGAPVTAAAGGLLVEHPLVQPHVRRVDGTRDSVMGLCKIAVVGLLNELRARVALLPGQK